MNHGKPVIVDGVEYSSLYIATKEYNKNYSLVHTRIKQGYTVDEAFDIVPRLTKSMLYQYKVKLYPNLEVIRYSHTIDSEEFYTCVYHGCLITLDKYTIIKIWRITRENRA